MVVLHLGRALWQALRVEQRTKLTKVPVVPVLVGHPSFTLFLAG